MITSLLLLGLALPASAPAAEVCREKAVRTYMGPGEDGKWATLDDAIFSVTEFIWDEQGRVVAERTVTGAGVDGLWGTEDDVMGTRVVHGYDGLGHRVQSLVYNGPGADGVWKTADDDLIYDNRMAYDPFGHILEERSYGSPGSDAVWRTEDDELLAENLHEWKDGREVGIRIRTRDEVTDEMLESRLAFEYDRKGRRSRVVGYQTASTDAVAQPEVSRSVSDWEQGRLVRTVDYLEAGFDRRWGTADDLVGSITVYEYDEEGRTTATTLYGGRGPDQTWGTPDDEIHQRVLTIRECPAEETE